MRPVLAFLLLSTLPATNGGGAYAPPATGNVKDLLQAAENTYDAAVKSTLLARAFEITWSKADAARQNDTVVFRYLDSLLEAGWTDEALRVFLSLPREVQARLLSHHDAGTGHPPLQDLRLPLAAAAELARDRPTQELLLSEIHAPDGTAGQTPPPDDLVAQAVASFLELTTPEWSHATDPYATFERLYLLIQDYDSRSSGIDSGAVLRFLAERAAESGYDELAVAFLERASYRIDPRKIFPPDQKKIASFRLAPLFSERRSKRQQLYAQIQERIRALTPTARDTASVPVPELENSNATSVFEELPLPRGIRPIERDASSPNTQSPPKPPNVRPLRVERRGDVVVALFASQSYDPAGEVSAGAYWLVRSFDGGRTWEHPVYTGLRVYAPYVARTASKLPLFDGETLQIEVEIQELDQSSITFPPVALRLARHEKGIYLRTTWETLTLDTDADGLSDLVEQRLLLDPERADSDGDGIPDGQDVLPNVTNEPGTASRRASALAAALSAATRQPLRALIPSRINGKVECAACFELPSDAGDGAIFVVGDPTLFRSLVPKWRTIVLDSEQLAAARSRFGTFYPLSIRLQLFDRANQRGLVVWTERWRGGIVRLRWQDGAWQSEVVWSWIT